MTGPAAPHGTTSTLPPLSGLVAGCAVLVVAVIFITQNAPAHHVEPSGWGRTDRQDHETRQRAGPALPVGRRHTPAIAKRPVRRRSHCRCTRPGR